MRSLVMSLTAPDLPANRLQSVTSTYMFPFDEDLCSFDFEVDPADEYMCAFGPLSFLAGKSSGKDIPIIGKDKQIDNP